jgi:hypothetical protein
MKKLILILLIIWISYILIIFKLPTLASTISENLWLKNIQNFIIKFKKDVDRVSTDPAIKDKIIDSVNKTVSWGIDLKNKIVDRVDKTKEKIDDVRKTLSWAEEKFNSLKESYNKAMELVDETKETLK